MGKTRRDKTHHMEGAEGRPIGRRQLITTPRRSQYPPPRGNQDPLLRLGRSHVALPGNVGGAPPIIVLGGQQSTSTSCDGISDPQRTRGLTSSSDT
jgi:hypothetical protein